MALTVPSHRIQTIHGVFGGPSWSSILPAAASSSHVHELSFNSLPNTSLSSPRGRGVNLSVLAARTNALSTSTTQAPATPVMTRPRRSSVHSVPVSICHAPSTPPSRAAMIASTSIAVEDPFADAFAAQDFLMNSLPPPRTTVSRSTQQQSFPRTQLMSSGYIPPSSTYVYSTSTPLRAQRDNQRTAKLVASVLLSRASGKPMRRRVPSMGEEKQYVKSCLSRMVAVEC